MDSSTGSRRARNQLRPRREEESPLELRRHQNFRLRRMLIESEGRNTRLESENEALRANKKVLDGIIRLHKQQIERYEQFKLSNAAEWRDYHGRDGWQVFKDGAHRLREDQIDNAIIEVEELRLKFRRGAQREQQPARHRNASRERYADGVPVDTSGANYQSINSEESTTRSFEGKSTADATIFKRQTLGKSATQPMIASREPITQPRSRQPLQLLKRGSSFQNLTAAGARFGGKVAGFFGKSPRKDKVNGHAVDAIIEEDEDGTSQAKTPERPTILDASGRGHLTGRRSHILASHPIEIRQWSMEDAQEAHRESVRQQRQAHISQGSKEIEEGLVSHLGTQHAQHRPERGNVQTMRYPPASRFEDESVFGADLIPFSSNQASPSSYSSPRIHPHANVPRYLEVRSSSGHLLLQPDPSPRSRNSLPATRINRTARVFGPPTFPPPDRPLPALPAPPARRSRPISAPAQSPLRPVTVADEVEEETEQEEPLVGEAPSPGPSTGSPRPWSPTPGGNELLSDIGTLSWREQS